MLGEEVLRIQGVGLLHSCVGYVLWTLSNALNTLEALVPGWDEWEGAHCERKLHTAQQPL